MPVLMQDVAKAANVSVTTVSHVLNDTRPIAPETRARVLKAIKDLNYYKNTSARLLVRGYSDALGLIISDIENPFFPQLIKGFEQACQAEHLELVLGMTNYERTHADAAVRRMIEDKVRGVAVMSTQFDSKLVDRLLARDIPVVLLNDARVGRNLSNIQVDYSIGVAQAIEHLGKLGHRDVAIIHGPPAVLSSNRYRKLLVKTVEQHGMHLVGCLGNDSSANGGAEGIRKLLQSKNRPTAVLCANDLVGIGAMGEAFRRGWNVPDRLSIIGADDIPFASYSHPPLSTVRIARNDIGRSAFKLLQAMEASKGNPGTEITVSTQFVPRESTGPMKP